jgi:hypothetical protein
MAFQSLDLSTNLTLRGLNDVNRPQAVYDVSGGYRSLYYVMSIISNTTKQFPGSPEVPYSVGYNSTDRRFQTTYLDDLSIIATIQNRTVVGVNLVLTITGVNNDAFRRGDVVLGGMDFSRLGQVVTATAGTIEIAPFQPLNAFAVTDFAVGAFVRVAFDSSNVVRSTGKTSLTVTPRTDWNTISTIRDSFEWSLQNTNVASLISKVGDGGLWQNAQINLTSQRMLTSIDKAMLISQRAQSNNALGEQDTFGGLDWALRNRNGYVVDLQNAMTRGQFEDFLTEVTLRKSGNRQNIGLLVMGTQAFNRISSFGNGDFIRYQRDLSDGDKTLGVNFQYVEISGRRFALYIADVLDNRFFFPETSTIAGVNGTIKSNDIYYIDTEPIKTDNGMGFKPAVEMLHWSPDGTPGGGQPFYAGMINGMNNAVVSSADIISASANNVVTPVEGSALHLMYKGGMNMITGEFSGKIGYLF